MSTEWRGDRCCSAGVGDDSNGCCGAISNVCAGRRSYCTNREESGDEFAVMRSSRRHKRSRLLVHHFLRHSAMNLTVHVSIHPSIHPCIHSSTYMHCIALHCIALHCITLHYIPTTYLFPYLLTHLLTYFLTFLLSYFLTYLLSYFLTYLFTYLLT